VSIEIVELITIVVESRILVSAHVLSYVGVVSAAGIEKSEFSIFCLALESGHEGTYTTVLALTVKVLKFFLSTRLIVRLVVRLKGLSANQGRV